MNELNLNRNVNNIVKNLTSNNIKKSNLIKLKDRYFLLMSSIGWDADVINSTNFTIKKKFGKFAFVLSSIKKIIFLKRFNFRININDKFYISNWIICSNSKHYAGRFKINESNIFTNEITFFVIEELNRIKLIKIILTFLFNLEFSNLNFVKSFKSKKIFIEKIDQKIPLQIDGDYIDIFDNIEISSSEICVNLLTKLW